ncbi:MAG: hypothetical protein WD708_01690 [Kiritimatiellia bacterium]
MTKTKPTSKKPTGSPVTNCRDLSEFPAPQRTALLALATAPNVKEAAKACGLCERTLFRYLAEEAFCEALAVLQEGAIRSTLANLEASLSEAVETLRSLLADTEESQVRRSAAAVLLRHALQSIELRLVVKRLDEIEEKMKS